MFSCTIPIYLANWTLHLEHVYMRPEVNSDRFEISNRFGMSFRLHGNLHGYFTEATFQTIARLLQMCKWYLLINAILINAKQMLHYWLFLKQ